MDRGPWWAADHGVAIDLKSPRMLFLEDSLGKPREAREMDKLRQEWPQNSLHLETV